jgi:peptidoglycan/xylan/chitin deacetylase (PgdA/CDA1 family)
VAPTPRTVRVELTFDDGPHAAAPHQRDNRTELVLDTLRSAGPVTAGFFIQTGVSYRGANPVGRQLVERMHADGHTIGIHTGGPRDHEHHSQALAEGRLEAELRSAITYVRDRTGTPPVWVRPPGGRFTAEVLEVYTRLGLTRLAWDVDADSGRNLPLEDLRTRLTEELTALAARGWQTHRPGAVNVLLHDIQQGTATHLAALIDHLRTTIEDLRGPGSAVFAAPPRRGDPPLNTP